SLVLLRRWDGLADVAGRGLQMAAAQFEAHSLPSVAARPVLRWEHDQPAGVLPMVEFQPLDCRVGILGRDTLNGMSQKPINGFRRVVPPAIRKVPHLIESRAIGEPAYLHRIAPLTISRPTAPTVPALRPGSLQARSRKLLRHGAATGVASEISDCYP